jgi:uncharacterized delta-60 repeat protein
MNTKFNFRGALTVILPCLCWSLVASTTACGDDDDDGNGSQGGSAGSSAGKNAGGSSTAGKSNGGSDAGGKTSGGSGGKGGSDIGGDAGNGPGPLGGAGGEDVGGAGGEAGETLGGAGGEGGTPVADAVPILFNFSNTGHDRFYNSTFDAAGNLYAVGQLTATNETSADTATIVAKFTPKGELDKTFGNGGLFVKNLAPGANGELLRSIVVQSSGKIVAFGTMDHAGGDSRDRDAVLIRLNADGTLDPTFDTDGIKPINFSAGVVVGTGFVADSGWGLAKYPGADDRLVVHGGQVREGGTDTDFVIARFTAEGVEDGTFGTGGKVTLDLSSETGVEHNNASPRNITILPGTDGIVGAGYQPFPGADTSPVVWKVSDLGVKDASFGTNGAFTTALLDEQTEAYSAVVQPLATGTGYKLVTTGYGRKKPATGAPGTTTDLVSMRLTSDGDLDETYATDGLLQLDIGGFGDNSRNLLVLPDRRVVLVGGGRLTSANVDGAVAVLTADGAPDTTFGPDGYQLFDLGGPADFFWGVALSADKKTLGIAGIKGVGTTPMPAYLADDTAVLWLPVP